MDEQAEVDRLNRLQDMWEKEEAHEAFLEEQAEANALARDLKNHVQSPREVHEGEEEKRRELRIQLAAAEALRNKTRARSKEQMQWLTENLGGEFKLTKRGVEITTMALFGGQSSKMCEYPMEEGWCIKCFNTGPDDDRKFCDYHLDTSTDAQDPPPRSFCTCMPTNTCVRTHAANKLILVKQKNTSTQTLDTFNSTQRTTQHTHRDTRHKTQ